MISRLRILIFASCAILFSCKNEKKESENVAEVKTEEIQDLEGWDKAEAILKVKNSMYSIMARLPMEQQKTLKLLKKP